MWFDFKPTSTGEDKEELPLLSKEITTFKFSNPKAPIYTEKTALTILVKISLFFFFSNYKGKFHIGN